MVATTAGNSPLHTVNMQYFHIRGFLDGVITNLSESIY